MTDLASIETSLLEDKPFGRKWDEYIPQWKDDVPPVLRGRRLLRLNITREAFKLVEDGERDEDKIVEKVCGSIVLVVVSVLLQELVRLIVRRILERWT